MSQKLTILFATSTGNAEEVAERASKKAIELGWKSELVNVRDYETAKLGEAGTILLVASTWGEGEPPDDAIPFWEDLQNMAEGSLSGLKYGVLALGDSSYEFFCGFGQNCDARLEKLGAERLLPVKSCDIDYDDFVPAWIDEVFSLLAPRSEEAAA